MHGRDAPIGGRATAVVERAALFERLSAGVAQGVVLLSAAAGSGKSTLLRSWLEHSGARSRTAWVTVDHEERDAQAFWLSVAGATRRDPQLGLHRLRLTDQLTELRGEDLRVEHRDQDLVHGSWSSLDRRTGDRSRFR